MNSFIKKLSILFMILMVGMSSIACDFFTQATTTSITTGTTITTETTTTEHITTGTYWQLIQEIQISGSYKTVYELGESLDTSLMVVETVNGLGFKTALSSEDYTISGYNANSSGIQVITVTYSNGYEDLIDTFVVYVKEAMTFANFHLEVTEPTKTEYELGEDFDPTGLVVKLVAEDESYITLSNTQYQITGFSSSVGGEKTITVSTLGLETTFTVTVTGSISLSTYYQSAEGLTGSALKSQLHTIINTGFVGVTYGDARYMLDDTDRDPNNSNNVILLYLGTSVSGAWDGGVTWNREHVWPQSLLGVAADNGTVNAASDLQNLKPANPSVNSSRGNKYYDDMTTSVSYAPRVEVRGDIARILLYMEVMYSIYHLINSTPAVNQMALLDVLLSWHELDPVDSFEMNRNEVIYTLQKNRNPFIDYPHFVELIWG
jgi:endonuclease I